MSSHPACGATRRSGLLQLPHGDGPRQMMLPSRRACICLEKTGRLWASWWGHARCCRPPCDATHHTYCSSPDCNWLGPARAGAGPAGCLGPLQGEPEPVHALAAGVWRGEPDRGLRDWRCLAADGPHAIGTAPRYRSREPPVAGRPGLSRWEFVGCNEGAFVARAALPSHALMAAYPEPPVA